MWPQQSLKSRGGETLVAPSRAAVCKLLSVVLASLAWNSSEWKWGRGEGSLDGPAKSSSRRAAESAGEEGGRPNGGCRGTHGHTRSDEEVGVRWDLYPVSFVGLFNLMNKYVKFSAKLHILGECAAVLLFTVLWMPFLIISFNSCSQSTGG